MQTVLSAYDNVCFEDVFPKSQSFSTIPFLCHKLLYNHFQISQRIQKSKSPQNLSRTRTMNDKSSGSAEALCFDGHAYAYVCTG